MHQLSGSIAVVVGTAFMFGTVGCGGSDGDDGTRPPVATVMEMVSGNGQVAPVSETLTDSLVVRIVHVDGVPGGGGHAITWTVVSGGGSVGSTMTWTDLNGMSRNAWNLGSDVGGQSLRAKSGGMEVTFIATATAPPAGSTRDEGRR